LALAIKFSLCSLYFSISSNKIYNNIIVVNSRAQWPCSLKRRSVAAWLLGSRVRIPLRAWMFVSCVYMCIVPCR
jgi:hypothetical protein